MSENICNETLTLMLQLAVGDKPAFEQSYGRYRDALYFFIRYRCGNRAAAGDVFQEVWESLFRRAVQYTSSRLRVFHARIAGG